jgi:chitodextrinase
MRTGMRLLATLTLAATVATTLSTATPAGAADPGLQPGSISLGKPATASSERPGHPAKLATDGEPRTRWESTPRVDPQWITIDLEANYHLSSLRLNWAADCARTYRYELSRDATTWTTIFRRDNFAGGTDYVLFGPRVIGRYLRVFATRRCRPNGGYAVNEIDVFGRKADTVPPTAPGDLRASGVNGTSVSLSWTAATDNQSLTYDIYANGSRVKWVIEYTLSTMVTGLTPGTDYTFTVVARDYSDNLSAPSNPVSVRTRPVADQPLPPTAPDNVRPTAISTTCITVIWDASTDDTGVARYDVYLNGQVVIPAATTAAQACGLTPNTAYGFTVVAWDTDGNVSPPSGTRSVTTLPG